jgi:hypothetical protein
VTRDAASRKEAAERGALEVGTIQRIPPSAELANDFLTDANAALDLVPTVAASYPPGAVLLLWDGVRKACAAHAIAHGIRFTQEASHGKAITYAEVALDGLVPQQAFEILRLVLSERNEGTYVDPNRQATKLVDRALPVAVKLVEVITIDLRDITPS